MEIHQIFSEKIGQTNDSSAGGGYGRPSNTTAAHFMGANKLQEIHKIADRNWQHFNNKICFIKNVFINLTVIKMLHNKHSNTWLFHSYNYNMLNYLQ